MNEERKKEKASYSSPPKEAFTPEQLAAVIEHETAIGIYDGRYDDVAPTVEEVAGDVAVDAVAEPETEKKKGGWPKGKKRG